MGYYAGIDLGGTKVYAIITNEQGEILSRSKNKLGKDKTVNAVLDLIIHTYREAIKKSSIKEEDIVLVGMAVPSAVNTEKGLLLNAPNLGWKNIPIAQLLANAIQKTVFVDNDVNLGTYGEYLAGEIKTKKNIYGIFAGTGIGGGYIADGKLVRGAGYTAGEIGHITVKLNGPRCNCGNRGCLEAIAGKVGVVKYLIKKTKNKKNSTLLDEIAPNWKKSLGSSALRKAWEHGDPLVQKAIKRSAQYIGVAASTIINAIGVEAIILGGGVIEELADIYIPIIENTIETNSMAEAGKSVTLVQSILGDDAVAFGAAQIVKQPETKNLLTQPEASH